MKYFAKIKYLGTDFHGFQVQPNKRTVQGELCCALEEALGGKCMVTGCSRTDAGVHANEFCITIESKNATVPPEKLPVAVSRFMPNDLSLYYAEKCSDEFHPRYDAVSKEYLYIIKNEKVYDPFFYGRAWFLPRTINENGIKNMVKASEYLIGKHDFSAFMSLGSDITDTIRTVHYIKIDVNGSTVSVRICADGFLYNMVRIIIGTLIETAYGRFSPNDVKEILDSKIRKNAGMTAPPFGLYLNKVSY